MRQHRYTQLHKRSYHIKAYRINLKHISFNIWISVTNQCCSLYIWHYNIELYMYSALLLNEYIITIFSCDQPALRTLISVRPSVCLSVCLPVCPSVRPAHLFDNVPVIVSGVITIDIHLCKTSRSEIKGQSHRGHDLIWPFPDRTSSLTSHMAIKWCTKLDVA